METEIKEEKTIYHISHLHPLKLTNITTTPSLRCNACRHPCTDATAYQCTQCNYALDSCCARLPQTLTHQAHPCPRPLSLNLMPAYSSGAFICNACGQDGASFCFHCSHCQFDLHLPCASMPHTLQHRSHPHPLTLVFKETNSAVNGYICDLCGGEFKLSTQWMYICRPCDFGGHVSCFMSAEVPVKQSARSEEPNVGVQIMEMQRKLQASMMMADMSVRASRSMVNLVGSGPTYYYDSGPLPSQYASMANSIVMNNLALASMNNNNNNGSNNGGNSVGRNYSGGVGGPGGGDVARTNGSS